MRRGGDAGRGEAILAAARAHFLRPFDLALRALTVVELPGGDRVGCEAEICLG